MADTSTSQSTSVDIRDESGGSPLQTSSGKTTIADSVVAKIAGIATREISGVHEMGSGTSRTIGALREKLPGSSGSSAVTQGVNAEVGERQAAIDLDVVIEYGIPIVDVSNAIRRNVTERIERMTGLEVTEVNIFVDDVHLPEEPTRPEPERVQ